MFSNNICLLNSKCWFGLLFFLVALVAKRKSLFDDKAVEIEELTYIIKQVSVIVSLPLHMIPKDVLFFLYAWMN